MEICTRHRLVTCLKVLLTLVILLINLALFRGGSTTSELSISNSEVHVTEPPTVTDIPTATSEYHAERVIQGRLEARAARVRSVCGDPYSPARDVAAGPDLIIRAPGLSWCPILHAGTESWVQAFCSYSSSECNMDTLRKDSSLVDSDEAGTPIMTVRNPLVRFFSVYQDYYRSAVSYELYLQKGEDIVRKYRKTGLSNREKEGLLTEARAVIKAGDQDSAQHSHNPYLNPPGPSVPEFLSWTVHEGGGELAPFYKTCAPCSRDYNILRFEKLNEESSYLFSLIEQSYLSFGFKIVPNFTQHELLLKSFHTVPREALLEAYKELWKVDCDLFGYPCYDVIGEVLGVAKDGLK